MESITVPEEHKVSLEIFEGPLDLLLYLIKRNELDIYDIPIETITDQYMEYLGLMRLLDLDIAGEFIVMAATLMLIKSRMLLPVDKRPELDEEDEEDDPRWELVRQLVEYRKFKEAASFLQEKELKQENVFALGSDGVELEDDHDIGIEEVGIFDLITAFNSVLKRVEERHFGEILGDTFTVADQIEVTLSAVRERDELLFTSLFEGMASRQEIVCTFLAVLELIRLSQISVIQKGRFHEIILKSVAA